MFRTKVINSMKKNKLIRSFYNKYRNHIPVNVSVFSADIPEITPFTCQSDPSDRIRLNLLVPSINQEHIFGGISTALKFFELLAREFDGDIRIILTDAAPSESDLKKFPQYRMIQSTDTDVTGNVIVPYNDRYNRKLSVSAKDVFMATSWWTAYNGYRTLEWQKKEYGKSYPLIYFIQDFEPGFYPWSSRYALADDTYKSASKTCAVFNSSFLADYFKLNHYEFAHEYMFEPRLNQNLKIYLDSIDDLSPIKKKQIFIYGRPSVARNAFTLIVESLKKWVWTQEDIRDWQIVSAGELHPAIDLGNGKTLKSLGKMTLEEYAKALSESMIGISLMISPHPSYPPLEMAMFGMGVITNNYANKDLSSWHENIVSLTSANPAAICEELQNMCRNLSENPRKYTSGKLLNAQYIGSKDQFQFVSDIKDVILHANEDEL